MHSKRICFVVTEIESIDANKSLISFLGEKNIDSSFLIPSKLKDYLNFNNTKMHIIEELTKEIPYYLEFNFSSRNEYLSYLIYKSLEYIFSSENYDSVVFLTNIIDAAISIQGNRTLGKFDKANLVINIDTFKDYKKTDLNLLAKYRLVYLQELALKYADVAISGNLEAFNSFTDLTKNRLLMAKNKDFLDIFKYKPEPFIKYTDLNYVPKVSAITTFYNAHEYFEETLASLDNSNYPDFEVIIVNDGSTASESIELLQKLEKLNKYKIVHKGNGGPATARNAGRSVAEGEYILYLDSDDKISPDYLEKGVKCLINNPDIPFVVAYCNNVTENGRDLIYPCPIYPNHPVLITIGGTSHSAIYKKSVFDKFEYDKNFLRTDDWEFYINLSANNYIGISIPEFLFDYRRRDASISSNFAPGERKADQRRFREKHKEFFHKLGLYPEEIDLNYFNVTDIISCQDFKNNVNKFIQENQGKKVCFYGAGQLARELVGKYDLSGLNIGGFFDMSLNKVGQEIGDYRIYSVDDIDKIKPDIIAITVVQKQYVIPYLENIKLTSGLNYNIIYDLF
ncbi:MAG: hypothetical protein A2104_03310 [Candidatus Melainabacteria bacterium GWF2_32_7]|nr:MAG: hypothetical protein A2104_03310 [Candidatus Melainabacteria bacterium GWF2_32_7]